MINFKRASEKTYKILVLFFTTLILSLYISIMGYSASAGSMAVISTSGSRGSTVQVQIEIKNNPGIVATKISVDYNTKQLTLTKITNGTVFDNTLATFGKDLSQSHYTMLWDDSLSTVNNTNTGVLATLSFSVSSNAVDDEADIKLTLDAGSTFNRDLKNVSFSTSSGSIAFSGSEGSTFSETATKTTTQAVLIGNGTTKAVNTTVYSNRDKTVTNGYSVKTNENGYAERNTTIKHANDITAKSAITSSTKQDINAYNDTAGKDQTVKSAISEPESKTNGRTDEADRSMESFDDNISSASGGLFAQKTASESETTENEAAVSSKKLIICSAIVVCLLIGSIFVIIKRKMMYNTKQ